MPPPSGSQAFTQDAAAVRRQVQKQVTYAQAAVGKRRRCSAGQPKWVGKHAEFWNSNPPLGNFWDSSIPSRELQDLYPTLRCVSPREFEVLRACGVCSAQFL